MKKTLIIILGLTVLAAGMSATAMLPVTYASPAAAPPSLNIIPTYDGLNINATDGSKFNISTDKAWISNAKTSIFPVVINSAQGIALAGGGGITGINQSVKFFDPCLMISCFIPLDVKIDAQIPITNTVPSSPVKIADPQGLAIGPVSTLIKLLINGNDGSFRTPTPGFPTVFSGGFVLADDSFSGAVPQLKINNDGSLEKPGLQAVRIADNEGLLVADSTYRQKRFAVRGDTGAIYNPNTSAGKTALLINDDVNVTGTIANEATGQPVTINDADGLTVKNPASNLSSTFDLQGKLVNTNYALYNNMVAVDDPEGFGVGFTSITAAPQFKVAQNGDISHPGVACGNPPTCSYWVPQPVKLTDDEGVYFANSAGTVGMKYTSGLLDFLSNPTIFLEGNSGAWGYKINVNDYGSGNVPLRFIERNNSVDTERMRIAQGGNVGIGTLSPTAMLSLSATGTELIGSAMSQVLRTNAGSLGSVGGSDLPLASFGFTTGNSVSLGVRGVRWANPAGNYTAVTSIPWIGMDVDNTIRADTHDWVPPGASMGLGYFHNVAITDNEISVQNKLSAGSIGGNTVGYVWSGNVPPSVTTGGYLYCPENAVALACSYSTANYSISDPNCDGSNTKITDLDLLGDIRITGYSFKRSATAPKNCEMSFYNNQPVGGKTYCAHFWISCWDMNS